MDIPTNPPLRALMASRYGKAHTRDLFRRALREVEGAGALLDELERVSLELVNPAGLPTTHSRRIALQARHDAILAWRDAAIAAIRELYASTWRLGPGRRVASTNDTPRPQGPGQEESEDASGEDGAPGVLIRGRRADLPDDGGKGSSVSIHARKPVPAGEPGVSLDLLRPSSRGEAVDKHVWTPTMDKLLGSRADRELAKAWGMSDEAVRRRRVKLGIAADRKLKRWSEADLSVLDAEPDDAKVAAATGFSVAAVKTRRSRRKH